MTTTREAPSHQTKFKVGDPAVVVTIEGRVYRVVIHAIGRRYITHASQGSVRETRHMFDFWEASYHKQRSILLTVEEFQSRFDQLCTKRAALGALNAATPEQLSEVAKVFNLQTTNYEVTDGSRNWLRSELFHD